MNQLTHIASPMKFGVKPSDSAVKQAVHIAIANNAGADSTLPDKFTPSTQPAPAERLLSKLIDDDFPFDDSQLSAINGMATQNYACMTGAAGTGKTTTTKKLVDTIIENSRLDSVNLTEYFASQSDEAQPEDSEDDYEIVTNWVPSVLMVGFTGRSTQMIKRNFPRDWHGNIMTIHRALGFAPEWYEDFDESLDKMAKKMRFVPTYTADCLMPWDVIIIDEAGMVGIDLWVQFWAAMKPGCRIYMIGDINQLPPVHGRSIFGFAMTEWPVWELTHIHRQVGVDNPIVDNAWRVLNGKVPQSSGAFQMMELKGDAQLSSRQIRALMPKLREMGIYSPNRDSIITPINGEDGARGYALGQLPLNREFALIFNPRSESPRYIIDGGRERKQFAVGDKVMATKNDHQIGITNGMTGVIVNIEANAAYSGDSAMFGLIEDVNRFYAEGHTDDDDEDFDLDKAFSDVDSDEEKTKEKESRDRGPSSHIVTVRFGDDEHGFEVPFGSLAEVASLMTAYVVTCHKMQGGESPTIVIICHDSHRSMLYREWLYTAITRSSQRCILLYTKDALRTALNKQKIKGATLKEKVASFNNLQAASAEAGVEMKFTLPKARSLGDA